MGYALLDIAFCALTLYICLFITHRNLYNSIQTLKEQERSKDIWLERFLLHNGLIFFTTWITIATLLNFGIVLHYEWGVELYLASTIPLACLSFIILCWFILETFVLDKYVRYTFSQYIVLVVALAGSLVKNFNLDTNYRNSIFLVVLLPVAALFALVKVVVMIYRHRKYPIQGNFRDILKGELGWPLQSKSWQLNWAFPKKPFEPPHDKTNKMISVPREDSNQPGHPPSLISLRCAISGLAKDPIFLHTDSKDSDQTGRMPGWSESSLGAHPSLFVLSCSGSFIHCVNVKESLINLHVYNVI